MVICDLEHLETISEFDKKASLVQGGAVVFFRNVSRTLSTSKFTQGYASTTVFASGKTFAAAGGTSGTISYFGGAFGNVSTSGGTAGGAAA